jgi:hypothetical protein
MQVTFDSTQVDVRNSDSSVVVHVKVKDSIGAVLVRVDCMNGNTSSATTYFVSEYELTQVEPVRGSTTRWGLYDKRKTYIYSDVANIREMDLTFDLGFATSDKSGVYTCWGTTRDLLDNVASIALPSITVVAKEQLDTSGPQINVLFPKNPVIVGDSITDIGVNFSFSNNRF